MKREKERRRPKEINDPTKTIMTSKNYKFILQFDFFKLERFNILVQIKMCWLIKYFFIKMSRSILTN